MDETPARRPIGSWTIDHPRWALVLFVFAGLFSAAYVVRLIQELASGWSPPAVALLLFWGLVLLSAGWSCLRTVRRIRDPDGERDRSAVLRAEMLALPPSRRARKVALAMAPLCLLFLAMGFLFLLDGNGGGWAMIVLAVSFAVTVALIFAVGERRRVRRQ